MSEMQLRQVRMRCGTTARAPTKVVRRHCAAPHRARHEHVSSRHRTAPHRMPLHRVAPDSKCGREIGISMVPCLFNHSTISTTRKKNSVTVRRLAAHRRDYAQLVDTIEEHRIALVVDNTIAPQDAAHDDSSELQRDLRVAALATAVHNSSSRMQPSGQSTCLLVGVVEHHCGGTALLCTVFAKALGSQCSAVQFSVVGTHVIVLPLYTTESSPRPCSL